MNRFILGFKAPLCTFKDGNIKESLFLYRCKVEHHGTAYYSLQGDLVNRLAIRDAMQGRLDMAPCMQAHKNLSGLPVRSFISLRFNFELHTDIRRGRPLEAMWHQ